MKKIKEIYLSFRLNREIKKLKKKERKLKYEKNKYYQRYF